MGAMEKTRSITETWAPFEQLLVVGASLLTGSTQAPIQKVPVGSIDTDSLSAEVPAGYFRISQ